MWNLLCHSPLLLRHSSLPLPGFKRFKLLQPSKSLAPSATALTTLQLLHGFLAAAATKPSGRQPLLLQGCSLPFACTSLAAASTKLLAVSIPASLCLHIALSCYSIRACRLPAFKPLKPSAAAPTKPGRQPLLLQGCSLPFPGQQRSIIAACPLPAHSPLLLRHSSLPFASLQTSKTPKTLRGSFHQASRVAACPFLAVSVPALQPALCLHIALSCYGIRACRLPAFKPLKPLKPSAAASTKPGRQPLLLQGCSLPFPGQQRSIIAACPLPAHSPLLLRHSSLPFASLQTPKTPKTLRGSFHQASRVAACPFLAVSVPALQPALCLHIALSCYGIRACRLPAFKPLKPLKPSAAASTKLLAVSVPASLCLHIALSCYGIRACRLPAFKLLKPLKPSAAASTKPGRQPLLLQGCSLPFPGRQRSSIAACPLPAHSPLLLRHSSLPFARLQTLTTPKTLHIPRGSFHQAPGRQRSSIPLPAHSPLLLRHSSLPFASLQTPKTPKTLHASFHQASRVAACPFLAVSVPSLQPALCLHIALSCYGIRACRLPAFKPLKPLKPSAAASTKPGRQPLLLQGCSLPFPGRQRSSIAACPLPAHSPLLLRHSSLPFASLQTPKTLRGRFHQASRVAACPFLAVSVPSLQPALCLHIALSVSAFEPAVCQPSNP